MATRYMYQAEVSHKGLNKYRIVKATTEYELNQKVKALESQWNEQWARIVEREERKRNADESLALALELTSEAEDVQTALDEILLDSLFPNELHPDELKDHSEYPVLRPAKPKLKTIPIKPERLDPKYNPEPPFLAKISRKKMEEFVAKNTTVFEYDLIDWEETKEEFDKENTALLKAYNEKMNVWESNKNLFLQNQNEENKKVDLLFGRFEKGDTDAIERYYRLVLERIEHPFNYSKEVEVEYNQDSRNMLVELLLPGIDDIPKLKAVSYVKSKNEFKETYFPQSYIKKKYDSVIYQMVLQAVNYIFSIDTKYIDSIVVNGRISTIDKSTGKSIEPHVLSVSVTREAFEELNLEAVDAKAWFKAAKGVSATSLANITPIAPIISMSRGDKRFISAYSVVESIDNGLNLASMDWQDFENLIREIFEYEFNASGGEVKITQASRDGGVDAVAFDPDPIRGGKIVIQAKRYTNVVGVSAVRDLYGTVMNEGATKGILVTTSDYGSDAYEFAKGKPLTLMNGGNLLYLLEKHGYKARIDIKEAKEMLNN